jgi:hypothetical protein
MVQDSLFLPICNQLVFISLIGFKLLNLLYNVFSKVSVLKSIIICGEILGLMLRFRLSMAVLKNG